MDIKDKVIIITGASAGIGLSTAKHLSDLGAKVVLAARSADKINQLAKTISNAFAVVTDTRKAADIKNLVSRTMEKYGRVDVMINNAGRGMYGPVEKIDLENYKEIMELNVYGPLLGMQAVIPQMRKQGGGIILNISSRVSKNYFPGLAAYASTKYALNALSLTARAELEKDKIVVSVFHPKMTATDFGRHSVGARPDWTQNAASGRPPMEIDTPEQVAEKIAGLIVSENPEAEM